MNFVSNVFVEFAVMLKLKEIGQWEQYWQLWVRTEILRFALREVCFVLLWKVRQNNFQTILKRFSPSNKMSLLFFALRTFEEILLNVSILESVSVQRTHLSSFIRILEPKSSREWNHMGGKTFLLDVQKSKEHIEMKIKTWHQPLKEVSNLKVSPSLTCSVSRMKCWQDMRSCFL